MSFPQGTIPNCLRPDGEKDPRPVLYICYRAWEAAQKWAARLDSEANFSFGKTRDEALCAAAIKAAGLHVDDREGAVEVIRGCRIKTFEVRPPKRVR